MIAEPRDCLVCPRKWLSDMLISWRRHDILDMKTLTVDLGDRSYPIHIGQKLLQQPELITRHIHGRQVMVVTNDTIAPLYLDTVKQLLDGYDLATVILPDGEQYKNLGTLNTIFDGLLEQRVRFAGTVCNPRVGER